MKIERLSIAFIGLFLIIIVGLRNDTVGIDTISYRIRFDSANLNYIDILDITSEPLFDLLSVFIKKVGMGWNAFKVLSACIYIIPMFALFKKYSSDPLLTILFFILSGNAFFIMSTMRQGMALGFVIISYLLLEKRKILFSIFFIFVAILFHTSAIISILMIPFCFLKLALRKTKSYIVVGVLAVLIGIVFFRSSILDVAEFFGKNYEESSTGGLLTELFYLGIFALFFLFVNEKEKFLNKNSFLIKCLFIGTILLPVTAVNPALFRVALYFTLTADILIVNTIMSIKDLAAKISAFIVYFAAYSYLFFFTQMVGSKGLTPYLFGW